MKSNESLDFAQRMANVKSMQVVIRALNAYHKKYKAQSAQLQLEVQGEGIVAAFGTNIEQDGHEKFLELLEKSEHLAQLEHAFMLAQSYGASKEHLDNIEAQALHLGQQLYPKKEQ